MMSILVVVEHDNQAVNAATLNTLAAARQIGGDIHLLVAGANCAEAANAAAAVEGAWLMALHSAALFDSGELRKAETQAAMAKFVASDTAMKVTCDAVQVLGGYGYMQDYPVERMMRDAKLTQIYTGTNQITRMVAGRSILGR